MMEQLPSSEQQLWFESKDVLTNPYVLRYLEYYNDWDPEKGGEFSMCISSLLHGNQICPVCSLNGQLSLNAGFSEWVKMFAIYMQFKPLFCKTTAIFAGLYWQRWLKANKGEQDITSDEDYVLKVLTPESFVIHFCIRRCQLANEGRMGIGPHKYRKMPPTALLAAIIEMYNNVITCQESDEFTRNGCWWQSNVEKALHAVRSVGHHMFVNWMKGEFCKGECLPTMKAVIDQILDRIYPRQVKETKCLNHLGDHEFSNAGVPSVTQCTMDIIQSLVLQRAEPGLVSRLNLIRGNSSCLFPPIDGPNAATDLPTSMPYSPEECILCNMIGFYDWYHIIEVNVLERIISPLCNKAKSNPNVFEECHNKLAAKAQCSDSHLYKFLFVKLNKSIFYNHAMRSPLCAINRLRAHVGFHRSSTLPCGKAINYAMMYTLFVRGKDILRLSSVSIDKLLEALRHHEIYFDQQALYQAC